MPATVSIEVISLLDRAMAQYMGKTFGDKWRTKCHQSAKIAAKALQHLYPSMAVEVQRVEMAALMAGAQQFAHIGWAEDPAQIPGHIPAHFAVAAGPALYDPTFWQLNLMKTPLDLPAEPYFFHPEFVKCPVTDEDGFRWMRQPRPTGMLHVGYKLQPAKLPDSEMRQMMSDAEARKHARRVVGLVRSMPQTSR